MEPEISRERQKENSLLVAFTRAAETLKSSDPTNVCDRTGATFDGSEYTVIFLDKPCRICVPEVRFVTEGMPTIAEVLVLHYLTTVNENRVGGQFVSFTGIPNGMFYFKSFKQRSLDKIVSRFGSAPEQLLEAGAALGGRKWSDGEYATIIRVFPKIDLVVQVFEADDEFPAEANVLFSDNIVNFLPAEDTAFLGSWVVGRLAGAVG